MKAAAYIDNQCNQLVLIPESEFEKTLLEHFKDKTLSGQMAGVYECRGGYNRFTPAGHAREGECLVLTIAPPPPPLSQLPKTGAPGGETVA